MSNERINPSSVKLAFVPEHGQWEWVTSKPDWLDGQIHGLRVDPPTPEPPPALPALIENPPGMKINRRTLHRMFNEEADHSHKSKSTLLRALGMYVIGSTLYYLVLTRGESHRRS